jgi:hypothetical protein
MGYAKTTDPQFLGRVESWIAKHGEVLALFKYVNAAGSRDFTFFNDVRDFRSGLERLPPNTWVIVYGEPQLPLRGRVDDALIIAALGRIPDGSEYLIVCLEKTVERYPPHYRREYYEETAGETHEELREGLEGFRGRPVGVGLFPPWPGDSQETIEGFVPDEKGEVRPGAY